MYERWPGQLRLKGRLGCPLPRAPQHQVPAWSINLRSTKAALQQRGPVEAPGPHPPRHDPFGSDGVRHSRSAELAAIVQLSDRPHWKCRPPASDSRLYSADQRSNNPPTGAESTSVFLPTASVPSRTADRILLVSILISMIFYLRLGSASRWSASAPDQRPQHCLACGPRHQQHVLEGEASCSRLQHLDGGMDNIPVRPHIVCPRKSPRASRLPSNHNGGHKKFRCDGWLAYNIQFRAAASDNPALRWDVVDPNVWQLTMAGAKRSPCFICHLPHPRGMRCSFRPGSRKPSGFAARSTTRQEICHNFNFCTCSARQCHRAHTCLSCGGKHQRSMCSCDPQRSATFQQS